jgi:putative MFS transporter
MVYAAEEFPAERRGQAIAVLQAANALGGITCAATVPLLLETPHGWLTVYFAGTVPLLLLAYARRGLRETKRFATYAAGGLERRSAIDILRSQHRARVYQLTTIWALIHMCVQTAVFFWKEFAVAERGLSDVRSDSQLPSPRSRAFPHSSWSADCSMAGAVVPERRSSSSPSVSPS